MACHRHAASRACGLRCTSVRPGRPRLLVGLVDGGVSQKLGEGCCVLRPTWRYRDRNHLVAFSTGHVVTHAWVLGEPGIHSTRDHAGAGVAWACKTQSQRHPLGGFPTSNDSGSGEVNQLTTIAPSQSEGVHKEWPFAFTQSIGLAGSGGRQPAAEAGRKSQVYSRPPSKLVASVRGSMMTSRSNWVPGVLFCRAFDPGGRVPRTMTTAVRGSFSMRSGGGAALTAGRTDAPSGHIRRHVGSKIGWHRGAARAIQTHDQAISLHRHRFESHQNGFLRDGATHHLRDIQSEVARTRVAEGGAVFQSFHGRLTGHQEQPSQAQGEGEVRQCLACIDHESALLDSNQRPTRCKRAALAN